MEIGQNYKRILIISVLVSSLSLVPGCSRRVKPIVDELLEEGEMVAPELAIRRVEYAENIVSSPRRILPYKQYPNNQRFLKILEEVTTQTEAKLARNEIISEAMSEAHSKLITKEIKNIVAKEIKNMNPNLYEATFINEATLLKAQTTTDLLIMETDLVAEKVNLSAQNAAMQAVESAVKAKAEYATIKKLARKAAKAAARETSREIIISGVILITPGIINVIANQAVDSASKKVMEQIPES